MRTGCTCSRCVKACSAFCVRRARRLARVAGEPVAATLAHGREVLGAGGTGLGRTVRTTAFTNLSDLPGRA